jgi:hypothetical protein
VSVQTIPFDIVAFFGKKERARLMRPKEVIPPELEAAFDILGQLDPDWVWVLDIDGKIRGVLVASPAHGVAMIWRIVVSPGASSMALGKLLRAFLRDCRARGVRGYLTVVSLAGESQARLAQIIEHAGGKKIEDGMTLYASPLPKENL